MERRDFMKSMGVTAVAALIPFQTFGGEYHKKREVEKYLDPESKFQWTNYGTTRMLDCAFHSVEPLKAELWITYAGNPVVFVVSALAVKFGDYNPAEVTHTIIFDGCGWFDNGNLLCGCTWENNRRAAHNGDCINLFMPKLDELLNVK